MAWHFDETNDLVTVTDHTALTLPDADWTIAGWLKLTDNVGSAYQYVMHWGTFGSSPTMRLFFTEASAGNANKLGSW